MAEQQVLKSPKIYFSLTLKLSFQAIKKFEPIEVKINLFTVRQGKVRGCVKMMTSQTTLVGV